MEQFVIKFIFTDLYLPFNIKIQDRSSCHFSYPLGDVNTTSTYIIVLNEVPIRPKSTVINLLLTIPTGNSLEDFGESSTAIFFYLFSLIESPVLN